MAKRFTIIMLIISALCSCRGPEGPAGPPGSGLESLVDPAVKPKIIYTYPPMGSQGPYIYPDYSYDYVLVRFNKIMSFQLLRRAITITAPFTTAHIDTLFPSIFSGDIFSFIVLDSLNHYYMWEVGKAYTLKIDSTAEDINANKLLPPFVTSFTPEPYFRVKRTYPAGGETEVSAFSSISVSFNGVPTSSVLSAVDLSPPLQGEQWGLAYYDSTQLVLDHYGFPFAPNTEYRVSLTVSVQDQHGNHLLQPFVSTFVTSPFRVWYSYPPNGATNVSRNSSVHVQFNNSIDTGSVRNAFSISPPVTGSLIFDEESTYFNFSPAASLSAQTLYSATISTAVRSKSGANLQTPYTFSFTTGD